MRRPEGSRSTYFAGNEVTAMWTFSLCPTSDPKEMDEQGDGKSLAQIYHLDGDTLTIAFRNRWNDPHRPTDFKPKAGVGIYVLARKRQ
jgi:uncharacterized protein (TIGR03067 family)